MSVTVAAGRQTATRMAEPASPDAARCGVLLVNLGTPDAPTPQALRRYLGEFLADPRIVEVPRWLWWLVLNGVILRIRPRRSAAAYARVWTDEGSPLMVYSRALQAGLQEALGDEASAPRVELAMRYGNPSIAATVERMLADGIDRMLVLPLYPQYSATTTGSVFDGLAHCLERTRDLPELQMIRNYCSEPGYLDALAASVRAHWETAERSELLIFSFHGIPQRYADAGDPYPEECKATARALAERLELDDAEWRLCFQSPASGASPGCSPISM